MVEDKGLYITEFTINTAVAPRGFKSGTQSPVGRAAAHTRNEGTESLLQSMNTLRPFQH